jgi:hypothetical protein
MGLQLFDLDEATRQFAIDEVDRDLVASDLYMGKYLSQAGEAAYPELLKAALRGGSDETLAVALSTPGMFKSHYDRRKPSGGFTEARVPHTANQTLAEGELNRFYLRGLCRRAVDEGKGQKIEVYRARESSKPRAVSEAMIGSQFDPVQLLEDLRLNAGVDTALGLPPGPNSGLSGRLV